MDTLISNVTIVTMNEKMDVLFGAFLGIRDGKIATITKSAPKEQPKTIIDGTSMVVMPGLVNCHTHLATSALRSFCDDLSSREALDAQLQKEDKMDLLLKQVARVLAQNTNYATMISSPQYHRNKLKFIQLSRVDENQILAVIVVEGNVIKNQLLSVTESLDDETMLKLNILLNTHLNGLSFEETKASCFLKHPAAETKAYTLMSLVTYEDTPFFALEKVDALEYSFTPDTFLSVVVTAGEGTIACGAGEIEAKKGDKVFVPYGAGTITLKNISALLCYPPKKGD